MIHLRAEGITVRLRTRAILDAIDLDVGAGQFVCITGHNGAGKSTLLKAVTGLMEVAEGRCWLDGKDCTNLSSASLLKTGLILVPEGRGIFPNLTTKETLELAGWSIGLDRQALHEQTEWVLATLPIVRQVYARQTGALSGGQKQAVSIARALMMRPKCLLLDEPSIGLAPALAIEIMELLQQLRTQSGLTIILVEQNLRMLLDFVDSVIAIKSGKLFAVKQPEELRDNEAILELF